MACDVEVTFTNSFDGNSIPEVKKYKGESLPGGSTLKKVYRFGSREDADNFVDDLNKQGELIDSIRSL